MDEITKFRMRHKEKAPLWKRVPDQVWEAAGEAIVKVAGDKVKSKLWNVLIVAVVAAATKALSTEDDDE